MYQALYRKWRPHTFDDVVGQEHITETLKNQVRTGRLSHAYLFVGTRGTGKTTCAKILAKAVNCEHPVNGNPCNECASCRGIDDGSILDVVELDAASNNSVDNVRALRDEAVFSPVSVKKRVYIIDEVHMLSNSAFNALLKILEEPPEHLMFILATTELQKVPATILSRCQRHSFKRISPDALAGRIRYVAEQEHMKLTPDAADLLARLADGAMRDGLSLLDQCSGYDEITAETVLSSMGLAGNLRIAELLEKIADEDTESALSIFTDLWQDGKSPVSLLRELSSLLRDVLLCKLAPKGGHGLLSGSFSRETLKDFSARMPEEQLLCALDTVQGHIASLRDGRDPRTTAELCIVMLSQPQLGNSLNSLKERVARLEKMMDETSVLEMHKNIECCNNCTDVDGKDNNRTGISQFDNYTEQGTDPEIGDKQGPPDDVPPFALEEPMPRAPAFSPEPAKSEKPALRKDEISEERQTECPYLDDDAPPEQNGSDVSAPPIPAGDGQWTVVQKELSKTMNSGQLSIIRNQARGSFDGGVFTIGVPNDFFKGQLEQGAAMELIRRAVEGVFGRPVPVKIVLAEGGQSADTEKLKTDLGQFGNVKFE